MHGLQGDKGMQSHFRSAALTLFEIRRRNGLWLGISIVATLGVIVSAIYASRGSAAAGDRVLPNIGLNLFTAFLVAALIEIFSQIEEIRRIGRNRRELQQLFGFADTGASVAIVLPKFDVSAQHIWAKQTHGWDRLENHGPLIAPAQERIGVAVQADMVAASDLIAMFSVLGLEAPTVMWDDEGLEHYDNLSSAFKAFITIGIASNALAMRINDETMQHRCFKLDLELKKLEAGADADVTDGPDLAVWKLSLAKWNLTNTAIIHEAKWEPYTEEKWGLISKVVMPDTKKCVFLLAGMHSEGTRRLGDFIAKNWKSILKWTDSAISDRRVENNCFASMVDILVDGDEAVGTRKRVVVIPGNPQPGA